jgi:amidase
MGRHHAGDLERGYFGFDDNIAVMKISLLFCIFLVAIGVFANSQTRESGGFSVIEAGIPEMRLALEQHRVTSRELVMQYLSRLGIYEDVLHAAVTVNLNALKEADELDRERAQGRVRGPLHGIPIALKDNIQTTEMPTTGGSLAFQGYTPPYEATLTKNLKAAGAILIAKATLSELANWVAGAPTPMPGNYNAIRLWGMNPYDPRRDPRDAFNDGRGAMSPAGSSSGIGTAANLWAANVGTETSGSILGPSNQNMLAAIKPTVGRVSRWGVIPITADQDTAGPMAKYVADAAILLGAMESASPDANDSATSRCTPPPNRDYTSHLRADALRGARIGIPREFYYDRLAGSGGGRGNGGLNAEQQKVMADAIALLKERGAVVVDPANIPTVKELAQWDFCAGGNESKGKDANCSVVVKYGMKRDFNKWLATLGPGAPVKTLTELREWNIQHTAAGAIRYGESRLDISDEMDVEADRARYEADRAKDIDLTGSRGIDAAMKANHLDALLFPGASSASIAAKPGYPTVIVPFGMVPNAPEPAFPAGFNAKPQPYGVGFTGMACSEPRLIELAYSFEQATKRRIPPPPAP